MMEAKLSLRKRSAKVLAELVVEFIWRHTHRRIPAVDTIISHPIPDSRKGPKFQSKW